VREAKVSVDDASATSGLLELQTMDSRIREAQGRADAYGPQLGEIAAVAERAAEAADETGRRVRDLQVEERRRRLAAEEKTGRVRRLEERLKQVRTLREEAAVQAELAVLKRAVEQEEMEVIQLLDQVSRLEERLRDQREELEGAESEADPRRDELLAEHAMAVAQVERLNVVRDEIRAGIDPRLLRAYDHLARGGSRKAVARMTEDGACGSCYSVMPLQIQNEIRTRAPLVRCEACGLLVAAPTDEADGD